MNNQFTMTFPPYNIMAVKRAIEVFPPETYKMRWLINTIIIEFDNSKTKESFENLLESQGLIEKGFATHSI